LLERVVEVGFGYVLNGAMVAISLWNEFCISNGPAKPVKWTHSL